jgi:hypothetical protein
MDAYDLQKRSHPIMKRQSTKVVGPVLLEKYDFRTGVRGKYAESFTNGRNLVVLDPDVAEVFKDSESVNQALRALAEIIQNHKIKTTKKTSRKIASKRARR